MDFDFAYCPIIKGKLNDIKAMSFIAPPLAATIKPLYELPPFKPTDDPEVVLSRFASRLWKSAVKHPCYVDFPLLKPGARTSSGDIALEVAYGQLNAVRVQFEPVYGFDRDDALWPLVARQGQRAGGMLLRLDADDLEFEDETIERIRDLHSFGIDTRMLDVLIDHRYLDDPQLALSSAGITADFIDNLASAVRIRKFIVAGSSAPKTVTNIEQDGYGRVSRSELTLWASLAAERLPFTPIYSDYGVIHPDFSDLTLATHINGKIRYTQGTNFHIHRGHSLRRGNRYDQYRQLSADVVGSAHYQGPTYSSGDRYIYDCAIGHVGTGNPGTWVFVDQNHHFSYTAKQIQLLRALAAGGFRAESIMERA